MVKEVRGVGLLNGIEFTAPRSLRLRVPFEAFKKIHPGMFGQVLVMRLFRDQGMLTQICGNHFMVLKVAPPLMVEDRQHGRVRSGGDCGGRADALGGFVLVGGSGTGTAGGQYLK